jgi:predicted  nucleic acid-binding Zn-ribbon protein
VDSIDDIIEKLDKQNKRILEVIKLAAETEVKMADNYNRDECQRAMERVHMRIDEINNSAIEMKTDVRHMRNMVDKMYTLVHGNGTDGLATKISRNNDAVNRNFLLIRILITAIIGSSLAVIMMLMKK